MKSLFTVIGVIAIGSVNFASAENTSAESSANQNSKWRPLQEKSFDGWKVFSGVPHKSVRIPGFPQSTSEDGHTSTPVGLGDPLKIFTIDESDGPPRSVKRKSTIRRGQSRMCSLPWRTSLEFHSIAFLE